MSSTFSLQGKIGVDTRDFVKGMDEAADATEEVGDEAEETAKRTQKAMDGIDIEPEVDITPFDDLVQAARESEDELEDLDNVTVSPDVDTSGVDNMKKSTDGAAESARSGIGPLRGLTDEMGESAGAAGAAASAFLDGGEAVENFGAQAGLSEELTGKLSSALAVGVGAVAAATFAWTAYREEQERAKERGEDLLEVQEALAEGKFADAASKLNEEFGGFLDALEDKGVSAAETVAFLTGETVELGVELSDMERKTLKGLTAGFQGAEDEMKKTIKREGELRTAFAQGDEVFQSYDEGLNTVIEDLERFGEVGVDAISLVQQSWNTMRDDLTLEREALRAEQAFRRISAAARSDGRITRLEIADMKLAAADWLDTLEGIPDSVRTEIRTLIDDESFRVAEARLKVLTAIQTKTISVRIDSSQVPPGLNIPEATQGPAPSVPSTPAGGGGPSVPSSVRLAEGGLTQVQVFIDGQELQGVAASTVRNSNVLAGVLT